jgi:transcriptional regulator with XRE-family HTH domain
MGRLAMDTVYVIGNRMRQMRQARCVTQTVWASVLGVSQNTYSQKETGRSTFSVEEVQSLCRVAEVDPRYILGEMTWAAADGRHQNEPLDELLRLVNGLGESEVRELLQLVRFRAEPVVGPGTEKPAFEPQPEGAV